MAPQQGGHLGQHHLGDKGQIQRARLAQADPMQMRQLGACGRKAFGIAGDPGCWGQKKPRIKAAAAPGRGDGAKHKAQIARQGGGDLQSGFLVQFTQGRARQRARMGRAFGAVQRQTRSAVWRQPNRRRAAVFRIDRPARKHIFRRHKRRRMAAHPHQDLKALAVFAPQNHRGGGANRLTHRQAQGLDRARQNHACAWPIAARSSRP